MFVVLFAVFLASCYSEEKGGVFNQIPDKPTVTFKQLVYVGQDEVYEQMTLQPDEMHNPIFAGYYPDPSITQVAGNYYTVNSTFAHFPGIPIMHSTDLVNWQQIGNAIDRADMLDFKRLGLSRGVFAPTIEHHDGTYYIATTCVDCGGNFIITAQDPAGPWSNPVWLPEVKGIDPSLFFDVDGSIWLMNNDEPKGGSTYEGHRAIWIRKIDPHTFQSISAPKQIINGGVKLEDKPIWIEGPHIYKVGDFYYLSAAEGGTAINHSQVILRSKRVDGPYVPYQNNPILTQRDLPTERQFPITSVGHADYFTDDKGDWWAVFLGVRPYQNDYYNTGRETFMLPVRWTEDQWPIILDEGQPVPYSIPKPNRAAVKPSSIPLNGNFEFIDTFASEDMPLHYITHRVPKQKWWSIDANGLSLVPQADSLGDGGQSAYWGRRQQHLHAKVQSQLIFSPQFRGDEAGLAAVQSDDFFYAIGIRADTEDEWSIVAKQKAGANDTVNGAIISLVKVAQTNDEIGLKIESTGKDGYTLSYRLADGDWQILVDKLDPTVLSTKRASGFVGTTLGMYADGKPR